MTFAHVAVPVPARVGSLFTYTVPSSMEAEPGSIAVVPFGSRVLPGVVVGTDGNPPNLATRELLGLVEGAPSLSPERVEVASWIARYYQAPLFDALGLFLPPGWQRAIVEQRGAEGAAGWRFQWPQSPIWAETVVALAPDGECAGPPKKSRPGARERVAAFLRGHGPTPAGRVAAEAGCALATVQRMVGESLVLSRPEVEKEPGCPPPVFLNDAQAAALAPMAAALESRSHQVFLLQGVTGSGKTQVYLRLIETAVRLGRRAIVLVSEIAQTPEALERYSERFPGRVALLHSRLRDAERWDLWQGIYHGRFDVVVGPRSALFAPVPKLGLIVLDEEHEPAYKQEDRAPRYHARGVAVQLARSLGAAVVLGSATPDVVSYYRAEKGIYQLATLPDRYSGPSSRGWSAGKLPRVEVVDLRDELRAGNTSILSRRLQAGLTRVLDAGEQAILFLNRRGASTCVLCRDCGHVLKCRRCDVPLVYHRETSELVCHQCNRRGPLPASCPRCRGTRIGFFGAGTERVEEEVRKLFPAARILRWDHDVVGRQGAHQRIHAQFQRHEADVLVGTQMVAKALDFPLVTLVGVVLADVTLHLPEYRAAERTFQLLAQVAGRAGRGTVEGRVIIQTYSPTHYSVVAASHHDYRAFYQQELAFRRYHSYPPFRRLARLMYSGSGEARARFDAVQMLKQLQAKVDESGIADVDLFGPAPAFHSRVRGRYRWQILLAGEGFARLLSEVALPLGWSVDVDPASLL
ncbi:MAG: replication restart helicase PriA [Chloroflexota bacterium]